MLGTGNISGLDGVDDKDQTCRAGGHTNIAWVTDSSSYILGNSYCTSYYVFAKFLVTAT